MSTRTVLLAVCYLTVASAGQTQPETASTVEADFVAPQIILKTQQQPVYPPAAMDARVGASVVVEMTVLTDGTVGEVKVVECTRPKMGFEKATVDALKKWRFQPGTQAGEPIQVTTRLRLNFERSGVGLSDPEVSASAFSSSRAPTSSAENTSPTPK